MAISAVIELAQQTLLQTHSLLTPPADSGASTADNFGARLGDLAAETDTSRRTVSGSTAGETANPYDCVADTATRRLTDLGAHDANLGMYLREASEVNRTAHTRSASIITAADADIAYLTTCLDAPGSQKALLAALRGHVAEQDELIRATQAVGEHLAAQLRTKLDSPTGDAPTEADRGTTMLGFGPRALSQSPPPRPDPVAPLPPITVPAPLQDFTGRQLQGQPIPGWSPPPPAVTGDPIKMPPAPNPVTVVDMNIDPGPVDLFPRCDGGDTVKAGLTVAGGMLTAVGAVAGTAPTMGTSLLGLSVAGMTIGSGIDDLYNCK
ncbi:hypothetical protein BVC93_32155 (plasmid) [Mycobacterium sp. MS1601]|uniref:hypothetical protein n=1 Tax=Mycobacterium sp. MS1601 TaxID=1936029 RepID=UPI00097943B2|nr:hypothetical protein [Mycobacterium sp. MS1601]AQA07146.1 hypothetical protein BVC93_32155 [Mycobacterium sp. MS1601]